MKTFIKRATMWLHNHEVIGASVTAWVFAAFDLGSA
jgi:hypothetical protein